MADENFAGASEGQRPAEGQNQSPSILSKKQQLLRRIIDFSYLKALYVKPRQQVGDSLEELGFEFRLFEAYLVDKQPPVIIVDQNGYVSTKKLNYALRPLEAGEIAKIQEALPSDVNKRIERIIADYGPGNYTVFFGPVAPLKDPKLLEGINWRREVLENIINYGNAVQDPRVLLLRQCTFLKGIKMQANPHFIEVLPSSTGLTICS